MSEEQSSGNGSKRKAAILGGCIAVCAAAVAIVLAMRPFDHPAVRIDEATFPDERLRGIVSTTFDANEDGLIDEDEMAAVDSLTLAGVGDYAGIETISGLDELVVEQAPSGRVAFPDGVHASRLVVSDPQVTELVVASSPDVTELVASNTQLQGFDPSGISRASSIDVANTQITELDVSSNGELEELSVDQTVSIEGLESTKLHENWIPASFSYQLYDANNRAIGSARSASAQFNEDNLISRLSYRDDKLSEWSFVYDDDGKCASYVASTSGISGKSYELSYDEEGRIASIRSARGVEEASFAYGEGSAPVSCAVASESGKSVDLFGFVYNQDGLLCEFADKPEGRAALDGDLAKCSIGYSAGRPVTIEAERASRRSGGYKVVRTSSGDIEKVLYVEDGDVKSLTQGASTSVTTYSYDEDGHIEDAVRIVANSSPSMLPVSKTTFTYGENELPVSWRIDYVGTYKGYKDVHAVVEVAYWRVLTADESFSAQKAILLGDVFEPTVSLGFVDPMAQIDTCKNIAYDGLSDFFRNRK